MKKRRLNIKVTIGLLLLAAGIVLGVFATRIDRFDYSEAVDLAEAEDGKSAFCYIEALEKQFAHSESLNYHLGYDGEKVYVIALTEQDQTVLNQKEHTVSNDGLLILFNEKQRLSGCCRRVDGQLRQLIISEYELSEEQYSQLIGRSFMAVNQPVGMKNLIALAAASLTGILTGLFLLVTGRKRKGKKAEEVCNKTVYLVE